MPDKNARHLKPSRPETGKFHYRRMEEIQPSALNARKHDRAQINAIASSIRAFGFNAPILLDGKGVIVAGHGRFEAARKLGLDSVPVISLAHLSETQAKAYMLADNKLSDRSSFDDIKVATQLKELCELALDFEIEAIGFEQPEIDLRIQSLETDEHKDDADDFIAAPGPAVSRPGEVWHLGLHRIICGNALDDVSYLTLLGSEKVAATFTDSPYNVKISGHAGGKGRIKHREFAMASGEMSDQEFTDFLSSSFDLMRRYSEPGALVYACTDWRHAENMIIAGRLAYFETVNLCIWVKSNGGMGSLYRSRHELIFVFRNGNHPHQNNVQLGRFGRNRTNVWNAPGANGFSRHGSKLLELHPTVKPVGLVADAILDSTTRGDIVLDPFLGSGTTLLAAERTGRVCRGIEIDPLYVDTAVERWQHMTGKEALTPEGVTFTSLRLSRGSNT